MAPLAREPGDEHAAEFKSEALCRGCEQHGVTLRWRPPGNRTTAGSWSG